MGRYLHSLAPYVMNCNPAYHDEETHRLSKAGNLDYSRDNVDSHLVNHLTFCKMDAVMRTPTNAPHIVSLDCAWNKP